MESLLKRVDHLGIAVRDLTTAMATYSATLGLRDWETIELPERSMRVAVGRIGDMLIELIAPTGPEANPPVGPRRRGGCARSPCSGS